MTGPQHVSIELNSDANSVALLTKDPKSVCAPIAACSSEMPSGLGGFLMHLDSLPLGSSRGCCSASAPLGSPSLSLRTSISV